MSETDFIRLRQMLAELAPQGRAALLPALHAAQRLYGWLPEAVAAEVGRVLKVPLAEVYGVIDFYAMFSREPMGRTIVRVCSAPVCALAGYGIGHLIAPFYYDSFHDRDLAAAIYGMPLIGFPLYIISLFLLWRMARSR